jgi:hypothetical protein
MAGLGRDFWIRETGKSQQVVQLHDRYMMMMMMMMKNGCLLSVKLSVRLGNMSRQLQQGHDPVTQLRNP